MPTQFACFVSICLMIGLAGCQPSESSRKLAASGKAAGKPVGNTGSVDADKPLVVAVSYPLEYLTQRITGDIIDVSCPVPAATGASHWQPQRDDILKMQTAQLIVANGNGAKFANWLDIVSLPPTRVCNSATRGLGLSDYISVADVVHAHGPQGEHSHASTVPYTWLDPAIAAKQAQYIAQDLARVFPEHAATFQKNLTMLKQDLDELSQLLKFKTESGNDAEPAPVIFTVNSDLKYFTRAAGWEDHHLSWFEPPSPAIASEDVKTLLLLRDQRTTVAINDQTLLLSPFPLPPPLIKLLDAQRIVVSVIDPLDVRPIAGNYLEVMKANIVALPSRNRVE